MSKKRKISNNIPPELFVEILKYLPPKDILDNFIFVCKKFYEIFNELLDRDFLIRKMPIYEFIHLDIKYENNNSKEHEKGIMGNILSHEIPNAKMEDISLLGFLYNFYPCMGLEIEIVFKHGETLKMYQYINDVNKSNNTYKNMFDCKNLKDAIRSSKNPRLMMCCLIKAFQIS